MANSFNKKLGNKIRKLREQIDLSQEELAGRLKINRVAVSGIEKGRRRIRADEIAKLATVFNTTSDILLDLEKDIKVVLEEKAGAPPKRKTELRINVPQKNLSKFKEVLLYILKQVGSKPNVGESVLYKLLYFIDFDYYEKYEEQLIGATYIKNKHGPTPVEFVKIVKQMEGKDLSKVQMKYFKYLQRKYLPLRKPDLSNFSARELETIDQVLKRLSDMNGREISDYSHYDVPWLTTEDGDIIEYESVFYRSPAYSVRSYDEQNIQ
jgi:transcriptional regulator with XRE-family HTH domain